MTTTSVSIKHTHKAFLAYYQSLHDYGAQGVTHETAVRSAFQNLLAKTAKLRSWHLVPELSLDLKKGQPIRPDGTLRDDVWKFTMGLWEAKDTSDNLDDEIRKKVARGYPLSNIIFEDTRQGVLFQNGKEVFRARLDDKVALATLLSQFYSHVEREVEGFEQAVVEFKERIPTLAQGLLDKIQAAHKTNKAFQAAFDALLELCRNSLNPNLSVAAVDEMLVQHLLTERLFTRIFQDQDFAQRNVIAHEIERVIQALVSQSFNRAEFLKSLDPFYKAIESAANTIVDFSEKQHFLNTVYERFFQGYSVKVADTHGIVYTPQPIVDFMCSSVEEVLKTEFGKRLGDPGVNILDPCTGTGNFIVNLLRRINIRDLKRVYTQQLFANEVMLLPYYVAAQNIEHEYFEITGEYLPFEGLCYVDTLELVSRRGAPSLSFMTPENTRRVERQVENPITVIVGNPPYNVGQQNENDNNKNRVYRKRGKADPPGVDDRISETYASKEASRATNKNSLSDMFVKFFRWATDRLEDRDGIVCFVSNSGFVENLAFDGMRKHLLRDFDTLYVLDCRGNVRQNPKLSGTAYNVFGIQVGVAITVAIRRRSQAAPRLLFHQLELDLPRAKKLAQLGTLGSVANVAWRTLTPDAKGTWLVPDGAEEFDGFIAIGDKEAKAGDDKSAPVIFKTYGRGIATCRDDTVYDFRRDALIVKVKSLIDDYNIAVLRWAKHANKPAQLQDLLAEVDRFADGLPSIPWSRDLKSDLRRGNAIEYAEVKLRDTNYRPFTTKLLYFDRIVNEEVYVFPRFFPTPETEHDNRLIVISDIGYRATQFNVLMSDLIVDLHLLASTDAHQCFPFYTYDEDGTNRRENITDWSLAQFRTHYRDDAITKWDIFHYVYGVLHQPAYREKFADNLKRELPRIPFLGDFHAVAGAGRRLADLHVNYETVEPWPLDWVTTKGTPVDFRVEKMRLGKDRTSLVVNPTLTLSGIPPEVFEYRLGNRSALEWVIDQYQVSTDKRSGITTDPNRDDDPEAIVRLVERVVRVSVETVGVVKSLP